MFEPSQAYDLEEASGLCASGGASGDGVAALGEPVLEGAPGQAAFGQTVVSSPERVAAVPAVPSELEAFVPEAVPGLGTALSQEAVGL